MTKRFPFLLVAIAAVSMTSACSNVAKFKESQYWQRTNVSESVYMRGQKAQQILNRDIARCVTDLRELERLGQLRGTIPVNPAGKVLNPDEQKLSSYDLPETDAALWAEHSDYHDFTTCMGSKGWERTTTIPYDVAERAEYTYKRNHIDYNHGNAYEVSTPTSSTLNE